jgi:hypothetical protein
LVVILALVAGIHANWFSGNGNGANTFTEMDPRHKGEDDALRLQHVLCRALARDDKGMRSA